MVATPVKPQQQNTDTLAREYISSLARGAWPAHRPDLGHWDSIVTSLEMAYSKTQQAKGDIASSMELVLQTLYRTNPELADLMQPEPTLDDIEIVDDESDVPLLPVQCQLDPGLARDACPWLDEYEAFSKEASPEGYKDYHVFGGIWALSVVNARRSYVTLRRKKIYGNVMLAFCGDTTLFAKSTTADVAKDVLSAAGLDYLIGPDKTSPAKLLSDMSGTHIPVNYATATPDSQEFTKKRIAMSAQKGLYIDELGKFISATTRNGSTTADFIELFLSLDACPPRYETSTIARSSELIQKPYLTLLGGLAPINLKETAAAGSEFWKDGLWARIGFIAAPPDAHTNSPLQAGELLIPGKLVNELKNWHKRLIPPLCDIVEQTQEDGLKGTGQFIIEREELQEHECEISPDAWEAWARYRTALRSMLSIFPHKDFHGSYGRLPILALRMALLMASLEGKKTAEGKVLMELKHWAKAQELAELLRKNLHELYRQVNQNNYISETTKLEENILKKMEILRDKGVDGITVAQLKSRYLKNTSIKMLSDLMESMTKAGILRRDQTAHATKGKYFLA